LLVVGAAPNAISYASGQFRSAEFLRHGLVPTAIQIGLLVAAIKVIWPLMGMPTT
jgi:sodium-dependent dicarboxylate transporter 2/3/5